MLKYLCLFLSICFLFAKPLYANEDEAYFLAKESFEQKLYPTATRLFKSFLDFYPESKHSSQVNLYIAKSLFQSQLFEEADLYMTKIDDLFVGEPEFNLLWAQIKYELGQVSMARDFYQKAYGLSVKDSDIYFDAALNLAKISAYYGNLVSAQEYFNEIIYDSGNRLVKTQAYSGLAKLYLNFYDNKNMSRVLDLWEKDLDTLEETALRNYFRAILFLREDNLIDAYLLLMQALNYVTDVDVRDLIYTNLYIIETSEKKKNQYLLSIVDKARASMLKLKNSKARLTSSEFIAHCDKFLASYKNSKVANYVILEKATALYLDGRINDSIKLYSAYLNEKEKEYELEAIYQASYGLGLAYLKRKDFDKAYKLFSKLDRTDIMPQMRATLMLYATQAQEEEGRFEEAMRVYKEILAYDYTADYRDYLYLKMAYVSLELQDYEETMNFLDFLDLEYPEHSYRENSMYYRAMVYFQTGDYVLADEIIESFFKLFSVSDYLDDLKKLQVRVRAARQDLSTDKLLEIYELDTKDLALLYEQALGLFARREFKLAIERFEKIVEVEESEFVRVSRYYLANAYYQLEEVDLAIKKYNEFLYSYSSGEFVHQARYELAQLYIFADEYSQAESLLFKNIRLRDEDIIFESALALKGILIEQLRFSSAQQLFDQLAQRFPHRKSYCYANKVDVAFAQGQWRSVVVIGRQTLELGYSNEELFYKIAFANEKLENYSTAIELYNELVFTSASSKEYLIKAYLRLAKLYEKLGDETKALMIYGRLLDLNEAESAYAQEQIERIKKNDSSS